MAIIKCLLTIVLLFVISQSLTLQGSTAVNIKMTENPYRLPKHVAPIHYDIRLIPHMKNFTFNGEARIDLEVFEPTYTIILHTLDLIIDESKTNLGICEKEDDVCHNPFNFSVKQHEYNSDKQMLTIHFYEQLNLNTIYLLSLKFTGLIGEDMSGFFRTFYIDQEGHQIWLAATLFQPVYARKAFPCWDEPAIKATFKFSIKHDPNYTALSNMPSTQSEVDPIDGKLWTYFETTPIMSTNILGFVIADYGYVMIPSSATKIWGPMHHLVQRAKHSLNVVKQATRELERFTKSTVHVPKMDHVAVSQYPVLGFESWGMIVYRLNVLLEEKSLTYKLDNVITIVHELTHQWFGNLVSPAWWNYLWLSEGMSTYLSYYIADAISKELRWTDLFVSRNVLSVLFQDSHCLSSSKYICTPIDINIINHGDVNDAFSSNTYTKSGALLRMVSHFVREDVFRIGLIKYLKKHKHRSVTPDDLWEALQDALDESDVQHNDIKVKEVMDTWFNQPAYPVVTIDRNRRTGKITVTQHKRFHFWNITETKGNNSWWIPLNYITKNNLNSSSTLATHWLTPYDKSIIIQGEEDPDNIADWIIVNKQLTGYYRVNYDITNWQRIGGFLNSDNYDKIPILNRAQIIDDVYYMMETEELDFRTFFDIIKYLWREIDLMPWYSALRVIKSLAISYLRVPQAATILKPYFFNMTYKLFECIGFDEQVNDTSVTIDIRLEFTKFACLYNIHPECREKAIAKLLAYVEDPIANKILSDQDNLLCSGLMQANESIWEQFLQINKVASRNVKFLGCSENLDIIDVHFNVLKKHYSCISLFLIMFANLPTNVDVISIIIKNYEETAAELSTVPFFETTFHRKLLNYFREEDIKKIKCLFENRTFFFKNEYLDDRIKKLNKINKDLSNLRYAFKGNPNFYF